jgi:hypothetical protein
LFTGGYLTQSRHCKGVSTYKKKKEKGNKESEGEYESWV